MTRNAFARRYFHLIETTLFDIRPDADRKKPEKAGKWMWPEVNVLSEWFRLNIVVIDSAPIGNGRRGTKDVASGDEKPFQVDYRGNELP
ncbi:hypothetical protein TcasGA2_TC013223 [Tribolium castaneum]|uniref:Uncharacterized protein n=1 Tax=Tribolium castaneum TaxID=7070 RepID=D6WMK4_TRICA|nr:hypothetical protein TcasGA2_TC013223 [Tribolium castaneum]